MPDGPDRNTAFSPFTLTLRDEALERAYARSRFAYTKHQGRTAILVGTFVYLLLGVLDPWFVPPESAAQVWAIRLAAIGVPVIVFAASFAPWFARQSNLMLASVGLAAGIGLIAIQSQLPTANAANYYPAMVMVVFYTYNFVGTRFIFALAVDVLLLTTYNLFFCGPSGYPASVLFTHDFFIVCANLIGGSAGYLAERQKRRLFLREQELDAERRRHMARALHDGLTGLPNRDLLYDRLSQAMAAGSREGATHCGFFVDLDGFKTINDTLSHEAGDQVLKVIGQRLQSAVRSVDTVARIGGDEFFVLALHIGDEKTATALAAKLLDHLNRPVPDIPADIKLGASIGLCLFPYEGMTVSDIIRRADRAMYRVKSGGKNDFALAEPGLP